ncbi:MAG: hypothetical protein NVS1B13_19860 [Flavisolibacter sp.]
MKKVRLIFPDIFSLWQFKREITGGLIEADFGKKTLICDCTSEQIELAVIKYKAKVVLQTEVI